jgi:hypothetical protein
MRPAPAVIRTVLSQQVSPTYHIILLLSGNNDECRQANTFMILNAEIAQMKDSLWIITGVLIDSIRERRRGAELPRIAEWGTFGPTLLVSSHKYRYSLLHGQDR